ncbi:hypothetical protein [Saccharothrix syringae]|uniref:Uncharacterized protein n=1 Tax=Saccharothrix syringae TaxID=103733 RepID=A0A5Q0H5B9_SACSY|nr:hypothetical protein [Saccharothrix syringae]QFZ21397.1 hypothetical protein EKG83_32005 [Saccharothrix syringae]
MTIPEPPVPEPAAPDPAIPGAAAPGPEPGRVDLGRVDLARIDLCSELAVAGSELRDYRARGDGEMAELLGAWIDTLLDEWNRRHPLV